MSEEAKQFTITETDRLCAKALEEARRAKEVADESLAKLKARRHDTALELDRIDAAIREIEGAKPKSARPRTREANLSKRVLAEVAQGRDATVESIATAIGAPRESVRRTLMRLARKKQLKQAADGAWRFCGPL